MDILLFVVSAAFVILGIWTIGVIVRHYSLTDRPVRFASMLQSVGLTLKGAQLSFYADHLPTAARLCMNCKDTKACDAWLASRIRHVEPPAFCPNASFIKQLQRNASAI